MNFQPHVHAFQNSTERKYYLYFIDVEEFIRVTMMLSEEFV